jgi:rhamnogalacturonan endolyase
MRMYRFPDRSLKEMSPTRSMLRTLAPLTMTMLLSGAAIAADSPAPVTVRENADGTVTMSNGIVTLVVVTRTARLNSLAYTYQDGAETRTCETLKGPGQYYYGGFMLGDGTFRYALMTDPRTNGGELAIITLLSESATNGMMEAHYSLLRGSPGFYTSTIMAHRKQDAAFEVGAWGIVSRVPPIFNWASADDRRSWFVGTPTTRGQGVPDSPHEISVCLDGTQAGNYADKFIMGQDHADLRAWGWSSVGKGGLNVGRWMMTTMEFSNGGPLKRDVSVYPYSELNNSILTGEVGMGSDGYLEAGEEWTKTCGPWFNYVNHIPASVTDPKVAARRLFADAQARADQEAAAWPYPWFRHPAYAQASDRGTVTGRLLIQDGAQSRPAPSGMWVGLTVQPHTYKGFYDFQKWLRPYQFWVRTSADGTFRIPHVLAADNYDLWAFGPGAIGTFLSHELTGGKPPFLCDLPAIQFRVTVKADSVTSLGDITWSPQRFGQTVFELGIPNRKADEFRHGEDYWLPASPPKLGFPTPVWGGQMEFPLDFPMGMTYAVGSSQWPIDWNYVLPAMADTTGAYQPCTGTITFDLAQAPPADVQASLYLALAGNDGKSVIVSVNGTALQDVPGAVGSPNPLDAAGFCPPYSDTSSIHFSDHEPFCDQRIIFPASVLRAGRNSLTLTMNTRKLFAFLMVDHLRLELPGYIPPAPRSVTATAGNQRVQIRWAPVPGASRYRLLRSAVGATPATLADEVSGPVCGSGLGDVTFSDTAVANGSSYAYTVVSMNERGASAPSTSSAPATPLAALPATVPPVPGNPEVAQAGHRLVATRWSPATGATTYTIWRTTMRPDGLGGFDPLGTKRVGTSATTAFVDRSVSDGRIYEYQITAENAMGGSEPSQPARAAPVPPPPAEAPTKLSGSWKDFRGGAGITLQWGAVPGATGYVLYRSTGAPAFAWPADFRTALLETTFFDKGNTDKRAKVKGLDPTKAYSFQVSAVNAGGVSPPATVTIAARAAK